MKSHSFAFDSTYFDKLANTASNLSQILSSQTKEIAIDSILKKICVSPPYFAFKKIYQWQDILIAPITREQPITFEATPMSSAEASRHMAILGSCAVAIQEEERHYYLARRTKSIVDNTKTTKSDAYDTGQLFVLAMPLLIDKKSYRLYDADNA